MTYSAWVGLMAFIMTMPATMVFTFSNVFVEGDLYIFHGGSTQNYAPAPVAGAGLAMLILCLGASVIARRFRRKQIQDTSAG